MNVSSPVGGVPPPGESTAHAAASPTFDVSQGTSFTIIEDSNRRFKQSQEASILKSLLEREEERYYHNFNKDAILQLCPSKMCRFTLVAAEFGGSSAPPLRRSAFGGALTLPACIRNHPIGFRILDPGSPRERAVLNYTRIPPRLPFYLEKERYATRCRLKKMRSYSRITPNQLDGSTTLAGHILDGRMLIERGCEFLYDQPDDTMHKKKADDVDSSCMHTENLQSHSNNLINKSDTRINSKESFFMTGCDEDIAARNNKNGESTARNEDSTADTSLRCEENSFISQSESQEADANSKFAINVSSTGNSWDRQTCRECKSIVSACVCDSNLICSNQDELPLFSNLKKIDCGGNRLHISDLSGLSALEELHIYSNSIRCLSDLAEQNEKEGRIALSSRETPGLKPFRFLKTLNLSFNRLRPNELMALRYVPSLEKLDLGHNYMRTIPLELCSVACPRLSHLSLQGNKLRNSLCVLCALAHSRFLEVVNLSENCFEALPSTDELQEFFSLSQKNLTDVSNTTDPTERCAAVRPTEDFLPKLRVVDVALNRLMRYTDIVGVCTYPALERIALHGNSVCAQQREIEMLQLEFEGRGGGGRHKIEGVFEDPNLPRRNRTNFLVCSTPPRRSFEPREPYSAHAEKNHFAKLEGTSSLSGSDLFRVCNGSKGVRGKAKTRACETGINESSKLISSLQRSLSGIFSPRYSGDSKHESLQPSSDTSRHSKVHLLGPPFHQVISLPSAINSDFAVTHIPRGQDISRYNLPKVLPSDRKRYLRWRMRHASRNTGKKACGGPAGKETESGVVAATNVETITDSLLFSKKDAIEELARIVSETKGT